MQPDRTLAYLFLLLFGGIVVYRSLKSGEASLGLLGTITRDKHPIRYWLLVTLTILLIAWIAYLFYLS